MKFQETFVADILVYMGQFRRYLAGKFAILSNGVAKFQNPTVHDVLHSYLNAGGALGVRIIDTHSLPLNESVRLSRKINNLLQLAKGDNSYHVCQYVTKTQEKLFAFHHAKMFPVQIFELI